MKYDCFQHRDVSYYFLKFTRYIEWKYNLHYDFRQNFSLRFFLGKYVYHLKLDQILNFLKMLICLPKNIYIEINRKIVRFYKSKHHLYHIFARLHNCCLVKKNQQNYNMFQCKTHRKYRIFP